MSNAPLQAALNGCFLPGHPVPAFPFYKPRSAYQFFALHKRRVLKDELDGLTVPSIMDKLSEMWASLEDQVKETFEKQAAFEKSWYRAWKEHAASDKVQVDTHVNWLKHGILSEISQKMRRHSGGQKARLVALVERLLSGRVASGAVRKELMSYVLQLTADVKIGQMELLEDKVRYIVEFARQNTTEKRTPRASETQANLKKTIKALAQKGSKVNLKKVIKRRANLKPLVGKGIAKVITTLSRNGAVAKSARSSSALGRGRAEAPTKKSENGKRRAVSRPRKVRTGDLEESEMKKPKISESPKPFVRAVRKRCKIVKPVVRAGPLSLSRSFGHKTASKLFTEAPRLPVRKVSELRPSARRRKPTIKSHLRYSIHSEKSPS